jgi:hypothetical protein
VAYQLRSYQSGALAALDNYWARNNGGALLVLGTGLGKSLLLAWLIRDTIQKRPDARILLTVHVQELLGQNLEHLLALWPDAPVGVNCQALGQRDHDQQILFASIQSIYRKPELLGRRDLMLIDEAQLVSQSRRLPRPSTTFPASGGAAASSLNPSSRPQSIPAHSSKRHAGKLSPRAPTGDPGSSSASASNMPRTCATACCHWALPPRW